MTIKPRLHPSAALVRLVKKIVRWNHRHTLSRRLHGSPDYLLKDIGIQRDQISAIVSGSLRCEPLALSPAGSQSSPVFRGVTPSTAENTDSEPNRLLAA